MCVREGTKDTPPQQQPRQNSSIASAGPPAAAAVEAHGAGSGPKARRRSIFDEDGNEIVLCSPVDSSAQRTASAPAASLSLSSSAVIEEDEDNNKKKETEKEKGIKETSNGTGTVATGFVSRGGSSIVSPYGEVLAGPQWEDDEGIIYADVDLEDCVRGRLDLDAAGSYSR